MSGPNYRFNPESLSFEKKERTFRTRFLRFLTVMVLVTVVAIGLSSLFLSYCDTPGMKALRVENSQLLSQYNILNDRLVHIQEALDEIQVRDDNIYRTVFNSDPISESVRKAGFGGIDRYARLESYVDADLVMNTTRKIDIVSKQAYIQAKSYEDVLSLALNKKEELASIPAIMPLSNEDLKYTSSGFGMRIHPIYKVPKFHWGIDFVAPKGSPIYATGGGKVIMVKTDRTGYGKHVAIDHGYGYETMYGHMSAFNVKVGQQVKRGQVIGFVGSTGTSTAPHVHYEVRKNGNRVDPKYYFFKDLSPKQYDELVAISSNIGQSFD